MQNGRNRMGETQLPRFQFRLRSLFAMLLIASIGVAFGASFLGIRQTENRIWNAFESSKLAHDRVLREWRSYKDDGNLQGFRKAQSEYYQIQSKIDSNYAEILKFYDGDYQRIEKALRLRKQAKKRTDNSINNLSP